MDKQVKEGRNEKEKERKKKIRNKKRSERWKIDGNSEHIAHA